MALTFKGSLAYVEVYVERQYRGRCKEKWRWRDVFNFLVNCGIGGRWRINELWTVQKQSCPECIGRSKQGAMTVLLCPSSSCPPAPLLHEGAGEEKVPEHQNVCMATTCHCLSWFSQLQVHLVLETFYHQPKFQFPSTPEQKSRAQTFLTNIVN